MINLASVPPPPPMQAPPEQQQFNTPPPGVNGAGTKRRHSDLQERLKSLAGFSEEQPLEQGDTNRPPPGPPPGPRPGFRPLQPARFDGPPPPNRPRFEGVQPRPSMSLRGRGSFNNRMQPPNRGGFGGGRGGFRGGPRTPHRGPRPRW